MFVEDEKCQFVDVDVLVDLFQETSDGANVLYYEVLYASDDNHVFRRKVLFCRALAEEVGYEVYAAFHVVEQFQMS